MLSACIICGTSCLIMILSTLFFPQIKLGKIKIDCYWVIVLIGAILTVALGLIDFNVLKEELIKDTSINPVKILTLFISTTVLSIFLDEVGFFKYLANKCLSLAKNSQIKLFTVLYLTVSVLTVFTSNDIIVLTFTPFICYFAKNAKINPIPYLVGEFISANTMSMMLIIGNPTNIYVATANGINFLDYFSVMALPTLASGIVAYFALLLIFKRQLRKPCVAQEEKAEIKDKLLLIIGLIHLGVCTLLLAIGSYIGLEMWLVSLVSALSLLIISSIVCLIRGKLPTLTVNSLKRAPWQLIPFIISMFTMILALQNLGFTDMISEFLGQDFTVFKYGIASFVSANLINNIPMSVLFCPIVSHLNGVALTQGVYATIVGSNLGAYLTPIGALAGIMWTTMLKKQEVRFGFIDFIKYGAIVSLPTLMVNLAILSLII